MLRQHGLFKGDAERYSGTYKHWDMIECAWKYNIDNIHAALLIPQLKRMDDMWEMQKSLYDTYVDTLSYIMDIEIPVIKPHSKSAFHIFTIWVDPEKRDLFLSEFGHADIGVAVNYRAIHLLSWFRKNMGFKDGDYPVAETIGDRTISLPFWIGLRDEDVRRIGNKIVEVLSF